MKLKEYQVNFLMIAGIVCLLYIAGGFINYANYWHEFRKMETLSSEVSRYQYPNIPRAVLNKVSSWNNRVDYMRELNKHWLLGPIMSNDWNDISKIIIPKEISMQPSL